MFTKDQIFELALEDYSCPRHMPAIKHYYGAMDEIIEFMIRLEDNEAWCVRYKETLDAAEFYDLDNDATHTVAGQTLPIFVPVKEISRLEATRQDARWEYKAYNGSHYPCYASKIEMRQSLVETPTGYEFCVHANLTGLQVCYPGIGWICPNGTIKGFPGMVTFDGNTHHLALAVSQAHYDFDEYDQAMAAAINPNSVNLDRIVADILAEG